MNFLSALGLVVRVARLNAKLSQERLAQDAGVYRNTVGLIERGEISVSIDTLKKISDQLGYRPWELLLEAEFVLDEAAEESARSAKMKS